MGSGKKAPTLKNPNRERAPPLQIRPPTPLYSEIRLQVAVVRCHVWLHAVMDSEEVDTGAMTTTSRYASRASSHWAIARCVCEWLSMITLVLPAFYWFDGATLSQVLGVAAISMLYGGIALAAEGMRRRAEQGEGI